MAPAYAASLTRYIDVLKDDRCANVQVRIVGHTDFRGRKRYNQYLSERRAEMVLRELSSAGVSRERLEALGRSEMNPIDPRRTAEARRKNRRVEISIVK